MISKPAVAGGCVGAAIAGATAVAFGPDVLLAAVVGAAMFAATMFVVLDELDARDEERLRGKSES